MVANGEATPEDIDVALMNGPAPRMAVQGQCMAFHVACGEGGMATNLDQFGPALKWPWTNLFLVAASFQIIYFLSRFFILTKLVKSFNNIISF